MNLLRRKTKMPHPTDADSEPQFREDDYRSLPVAHDLDQPQTRRPIEYAHGVDYEEAHARVNRAAAIASHLTIEQEIALYAPSAPKEPMPDYVQPRENVPRVGALSAEALVKDFEKTAKDIEAMAAELTESTNRCGQELVALTDDFSKLAAGLKEVVDHVKETAAAYRDEAKTVFLRIEDTTMKMQEVRDLSATMRERLAGSVAVQTAETT